MMQKKLNSGYIDYLKRWEFNEKQIALILQQVDNFNNSEDIDLDKYERDLWYPMNQSGLFAVDDAENISGVHNWSQMDTRRFITEIPNHYFR